MRPRLVPVRPRGVFNPFASVAVAGELLPSNISTLDAFGGLVVPAVWRDPDKGGLPLRRPELGGDALDRPEDPRVPEDFPAVLDADGSVGLIPVQ